MELDPKSIVEHLRHNLERYPFEDGFTVLRELLQNADDAEASRVTIHLLPGWREANNPLLRGAGLLLTNDGKFNAESADGMKNFGSSPKATDDEAVGRFGLGQKSVFHFCDAFVVIPRGYDGAHDPFVINPFMKLVQSGDGCAAWNAISTHDVDLLASHALPDVHGQNQLILWFPLRRSDLRPKPKSLGIVPSDFDPSALDGLTDRWRLSILLASLRHVEQLDLQLRGVPVSLNRKGAVRLIGYKAAQGERSFGGKIEPGISSVGREKMAAKDFHADLRASDHWPRTTSRLTDEEVDQKASPHGAVLLVRNPDGESRLDIDWSVLLPVAPEQHQIVLDGPGRVQLILHGCFFVDSGRKTILGFGSTSSSETLETVTKRLWNEALRDEVVLPLVPRVLYDAFQSRMLSTDELAVLVRAIRVSALGKKHHAALGAQESLARVLDPSESSSAAHWRLVPVSTLLRPLPAPDATGKVGAAELFPGLAALAKSGGLTLICQPEAVLCQGVPRWTPDELGVLIAQLAPETLLSDSKAAILAEFLRVAVGEDDNLRRAVAEPLLAALRAAVLGQGNLASDMVLNRLLAVLPQAQAVSLPPSAGDRFILRALAEVEGGHACLRHSWLEEGMSVGALSVEDAVPLLQSLAPLLERTNSSDAAGAAAITVVKLIKRLDEGVKHPQLSRIAVMRAQDGSGIAQFVSLSDLVDACREDRLLRQNPEVSALFKSLHKAASGTGALWVSNAAANLMEDMGGLMRPVRHSNEAIVRLLSRAKAYGPPEARFDLLSRIFIEGSEFRSELRMLAAGDRRARSSGVELIALSQNQSRLDDLVVRLIEGSASECLVPAAVMDLNRRMIHHLGITTIDGPKLGQILVKHATRLEGHPLDDATLEALLACDIPDGDLRTVPIFSDQAGHPRRAAELRRETAEWPVPERMREATRLARLPRSIQARARIEQLIALWSPEDQVVAALSKDEPHLYFAEILDALPKLVNAHDMQLASVAWLKDRLGRPRKPEDVLDFNEEVLSATRDVLGSENLSFIPISDLAPELREHAGFDDLRKRGILPDRKGSEERLQLMIEDAQPLGYFGAPTDDLIRTLVKLAKSGTDLRLAGWPLLAALLKSTVGDGADVLKSFATPGVDQANAAADWLNALADLAQSGMTEARDAFTSGFRIACTWNEDLRSALLQKIRVPVRNGGWRAAATVATGIAGLADEYVLAEEFGQFWPTEPHGDETEQSLRAVKNFPNDTTVSGRDAELASQTALSLKPIIEMLASDVPLTALYLFVGVIRQDDFVRELLCDVCRVPAQEVDRVWQDLRDRLDALPEEGQVRRKVRSKTLLDLHLHEAPHLTVQTLAGTFAELPCGNALPLAIVGDDHRRSRLGEIMVLGDGDWRIKRVLVSRPQGTMALNHLKALTDSLGRECLGYTEAALQVMGDMWANIGDVDADRVDDARARIRDRLPQILAELKLNPATGPGRALINYNRDEQSTAITRRDGDLPTIKDRLWQAILDDETTAELLAAVRVAITNLGYGPSQLVFELFQNADDASIQYSPPGEARFEITLRQGRLRAMHWGRPIGALGPDRHVGEEQGWQNDLFNMLLMNLSDKRKAVTGRFGLGFKSVHLIARDVGIVSDRVSCRVLGGMLPVIWQEGKPLSLEFAQQGRRTTVIDIEVDPSCAEEAKQAVENFQKAARWLPAMARKIHTIKINDRTFGAMPPEVLDEGISIITFTGSEPGKALALELDAETKLYLLLNADGPEAASSELKRLWLLAPLEVDLGSGWLLNSFNFSVDVGRGGLVGSSEEQAAMFESLGRKLGAQLVALYDIIHDNWAEFARKAGLADRRETGLALFLDRLVSLLSTDLSEPLAGHLHGPDRGLGRLVAERAALPTGLPTPFAPFLKADQVRWQLSGALEDHSRLAQLEDWSAMKIINGAVGKLARNMLESLGAAPPSLFGLASLVRIEVGDDLRVDAALAARLGRLLPHDFVERLDWQERSELLNEVKKAKFFMGDGGWREAMLPPENAVDIDPEERQILAFAPKSAVADKGYDGAALTFYKLALRQGGYAFQRAANFALWAGGMSDIKQQRALLRYVIKGSQGSELAAELVKRRPSWIPATSQVLRGGPLTADWLDEDFGRLLGLLYPVEIAKLHSESGSEINPDDTAEIADPSSFLESLHTWWMKNQKDKRAEYDQRVYPADFRPSVLRGKDAHEDREGWFTFFALGIFRTLPWNNEGAHKNFIEAARRAGWWQQMATAQLPDDATPWLDQLEAFASKDEWRINFPQWRRELADLYVLARWLPDYVDAFRSLPALVRKHGSVKLSRVWQLSASEYWQGRGLEGAPLTQSLGLGANWMIREGLRADFWPGKDRDLLLPYGWATSAKLRDLFVTHLGHGLGDTGNMDLSPEVFEHIKIYLGPRSSFDGDLDLPLQLVADGIQDTILAEVLAIVGAYSARDDAACDEEEVLG